jgi:hypothetical protein
MLPTTHQLSPADGKPRGIGVDPYWLNFPSIGNSGQRVDDKKIFFFLAEK